MFKTFKPGIASRSKSIAFVLCVALCAPVHVLAVTSTTTQTLNATIAPIGKLSVSSSITMTPSASRFTVYTANLALSYRIRSTSAGGGKITMQAGSDFTPAGGPLVSSGNLTYVCAGATLGTGCTGTQTVSTSSATTVVTVSGASCTGGGGACSSSDPNSVSVNLSLTDSPSFATGSYSAQVTFTISAT